MVRPRTVSDEQILNVACRCFLEHGPSVSTDIIAADLGVSAQALLKRFHSKQELLLAAICPAEDPDWVPLVEAGPDDRPVQEQLLEIVDVLSDYYIDVARRMSVLQFAGICPSQLKDRYSELPPLRNIRILASWLERASDRQLIGRTDFKVAALTLLSALHGPAMLTGFLGHHPTGHSRSEYVRYIVDLILEGLLGTSQAALNKTSQSTDPRH